jgi:neutral ceramidase
MANFRLGVALAGTLVTALVLLQLLSIVQTYNPPPSFSFVGKASRWEHRAADKVSVSDDSVFLLGAGKADITGY